MGVASYGILELNKASFFLPECSSCLWWINNFKISWFPVINAKSKGVNPSLLFWSKSNAGCVSKMALAFSHFSCSMALHKAEKWISECAEVIFNHLLLQPDPNLNCQFQAFISPFSHFRKFRWENFSRFFQMVFKAVFVASRIPWEFL